MPDAPPPSTHAPPPTGWWQRTWEAMAPGPEPAPLTRWQRTWRLTLAALLGYGAWVAITLPWG
ncbi:MAG: hypothetical protein Q4G67_14910, partial [Actinomycetia bacterium]|nr:hypothetical protein [Actinomycetes bacterium]